MKNKLLAVLLALCLVMAMLPAAVFAVEDDGTDTKPGVTEPSNPDNKDPDDPNKDPDDPNKDPDDPNKDPDDPNKDPDQPTTPGEGDQAPEGHCTCSDPSCTAPSHTGGPLYSHEREDGTVVSSGAECVNIPTSGSICDECLASIAANSGDNQDDDKKDPDPEPSPSTKPAEPAKPAVDPNAPKKAEDFSDVDPGMWYNEDLTTMLEKGWFVGQAGGSFAPKNPTTGAEVVVILSRVLGEDLTTTGSAWAAEATQWAAKEGLSEGISITTGGQLARQDLVLMLWRAAGKPESAQALDFNDITGVTGDALTALRWAVEKGIVKGNGDGTVSPNGPTKRCEMAALMVRYDKAVNG